MPSLGDSAVIIFLGLLLFGPKGLAQIARQLGKLMGEFRRASNEFRMQMEEELRISEQADRQKAIAAIEAAAPAPPVLTGSAEGSTEATSTLEEEVFDHPHLRTPAADAVFERQVAPTAEAAPIPIATSGGLNLMPPATGLPSPRSSSLGPLISSVPHVNGPAVDTDVSVPDELEQKPMRYTNGHHEKALPDAVDAAATTESVHG